MTVILPQPEAKPEMANGKLYGFNGVHGLDFYSPRGLIQTFFQLFKNP